MKTINDLIWDPNLDQENGNSENSDMPAEITPFRALPVCGTCSTGGCDIGRVIFC